jgi:hypothetical protein
MKRAYVVCLFLLLTSTFLLSQSNPVPLINPSARVAPAVSASQPDPKAQARILGVGDFISRPPNGIPITS